tara:strand:- start:67 stop:1371 length:1305 start_codon:yes stop_codon:yes gene_type:complete
MDKDKKTKKEILKEQDLMLKIMSYKVGQPTSEQLNEWSYVKNAYDATVDAVSDAAETVGDGLEYVGKQAIKGGKAVVGAVEDAADEIVDYASGNQGAVPDFIPLIGTKKKAEDAVKVAITAGVTLLSPTLPLLVKYICGTDLLPGLQKLYKGLNAGAPRAKNNVTDTEKQKLYRFNLRYYSPGKMTSNNSWGIPTGLQPGKSFPVSGHIGVRPDDAKLKGYNNSQYWTDWGPGGSGAEQMGNAKSHKFTGSFTGCKPDSKSCGKSAEGNYYIYLTKTQMENYFKVQPQFRNKKHSKWPSIKIKAAGISIPSMPNFCDPKGYHIAKRNCADATSKVLGLPTGGGEMPHEVAARALAKFPNKNADGESTGAKTSGSSKPEEEKPKPTIRKAWEMNNKGVQQKYKTFEDFEYAARYYQKNGRNPQALEDKPPYSYEK